MGWVFTWLLVLAIPGTQITTCNQGSDDTWSADLLFFSPALAIVLAIIVLSPRHHGRFLWLALPHAVLVPLAAVFVWPFLVGTSLGGHHLCSVLNEMDFDELPGSWWQPLWAPVQLLLLSGVVAAVIVCWKSRTHLGAQRTALRAAAD
jgi:hypothetical protein